MRKVRERFFEHCGCLIGVAHQPHRKPDIGVLKIDPIGCASDSLAQLRDAGAVDAGSEDDDGSNAMERETWNGFARKSEKKLRLSIQKLTKEIAATHGQLKDLMEQRTEFMIESEELFRSASKKTSSGHLGGLSQSGS